MHFIIFDIETTGLPRSEGLSPEDDGNYPQIVQIAWISLSMGEQDVQIKSYFLNPKKRISPGAQEVHGLTKDFLKTNGTNPQEVFDDFLSDIDVSNSVIISHNIKFDFPILEAELFRLGYGRPLKNATLWCTMLAGKKYWGYKKWPKLIELAEFCSTVSPGSIDIPLESELHNAVYDVDLAMQCFVFLMRDHSHLFDNIKIKYGQSFKSVSTRKSNVERSISISSEPSSHSYGASYRNGSHGVNQNTSFQESLEVKNQKRLKDEQTTDKRGRSSFIIIIAMLAFLWMLSKCNG